MFRFLGVSPHFPKIKYGPSLKSILLLLLSFVLALVPDIGTVIAAEYPTNIEMLSDSDRLKSDVLYTLAKLLRAPLEPTCAGVSKSSVPSSTLAYISEKEGI